LGNGSHIPLKPINLGPYSDQKISERHLFASSHPLHFFEHLALFFKALGLLLLGFFRLEPVAPCPPLVSVLSTLCVVGRCDNLAEAVIPTIL
jgi:hypothetical protein